MKNICALILACLVSDCFGDLVDNMLSKALAVKNLMQDNSENRSAKIVNKVMNSSKSVRRVPKLSRNSVFPKERIKTVDISPDGQKIAYLAEEGKRRYIKVVPTQNKNLMSQVITDNCLINNFSFIGKNLIYACFDEENNLKVKARIAFSNNFSDKKQLDLPENLKSVRLFKNAKECLAECYDGERYSLYQINLNNFSCNELRELSGPVQALFDKDLNPILVMRNENDITNVYVKPNKSKSNLDAEDEVDMGFEDYVQVDQIEDSNFAQYFSADNEKNCYKISIQKPQNLLVIDKMNPIKGTKQEIYRLKGVAHLSQCKVNVEPDGKPSFVTVNSRRYEHYGCDSKVKDHIKIIGRNFSSWYRISTTSDGKIWLICAVNDRSPDKFYLYDTRTCFLKMVSDLNNSTSNYMNNSSVNNSYLRAMECHFVPLAGGEYIQMFLTRGVNSTNRSPLILMMNSSGQYKWEYMPVVQVLANRGYNVLCLNYRKDDLFSDSMENFENSVTKATADIAEAINWSVKNNVAQLGNIVLLAKKHSVIPAMQMFLKNQKSFAGYIAISPSDSDINLINSFNLEKISKPTIFIGRFNNSEAVSSLTEQISPDVSSIISSNDSINQKLMTGIIEVFLAEKFHNSVVENISQTDINSLDIMHDGLNIIESSDDSHVHDSYDKEEDVASRYSAL